MAKLSQITQFGFTTLALSAFALAGCSTQAAPRAETARLGCDQLGEAAQVDYLAPGKVSGVSRVTKTQHMARALQVERTAGAELYVNAEPGVTPDYLRRVLSCQAASNTVASSPLVSDHGQVAISVRSDDGRLAVRAIGSNQAAADQIWSKAQALTEGGVNVEQVATLGGATY